MCHKLPYRDSFSHFSTAIHHVSKREAVVLEKPSLSYAFAK